VEEEAFWREALAHLARELISTLLEQEEENEEE
jgi:hypothetical protein